jgi:hypothetical protein
VQIHSVAINLPVNLHTLEGYGSSGCNVVWFGDGTTFRGNISPPSLGLKSKPSKKPAEAELSLSPASAGFFLGFDPEDGDDMFFRNVGLSPNYMASHPRRPYAS